MSQIIYSHWSAEPLVIDPAYAYEGRGNVKPGGLWFDVDGEWKDWCEGNSYNPDGFAYRNILTLDESRLLRLSNWKEIDEFAEEYGCSLLHGDPEEKRFASFSERIYLDWSRVQVAYPGILIAPYRRRIRFDAVWYYIWDCASGCVWDLSVVLGVEPIRNENSPSELSP